MTKHKTGTSLRDQLIGAWKLVSYVEEPIDPLRMVTVRQVVRRLTTRSAKMPRHH